MGDFLNKGKDLAGEHSDKVEQGLEQGKDAVNERTDNKYTDQVDKGADAVSDKLGLGNNNEGEEQR